MAVAHDRGRRWRGLRMGAATGAGSRNQLAANRPAGSPGSAASWSGRSSTTCSGVVDDRVGLDAQLSNWAVDADGLWYFDITTPLLADASGRTRMDLRVLTATLPAALRPVRGAGSSLRGSSRRTTGLTAVISATC